VSDADADTLIVDFAVLSNETDTGGEQDYGSEGSSSASAAESAAAAAAKAAALKRELEDLATTIEEKASQGTLFDSLPEGEQYEVLEVATVVSVDPEPPCIPGCRDNATCSFGECICPLLGQTYVGPTLDDLVGDEDSNVTFGCIGGMPPPPSPSPPLPPPFSPPPPTSPPPPLVFIDPEEVGGGGGGGDDSAGIIAGVVVALVVLIAGGYLYYRRRNAEGATRLQKHPELQSVQEVQEVAKDPSAASAGFSGGPPKLKAVGTAAQAIFTFRTWTLEEEDEEAGAGELPTQASFRRIDSVKEPEEKSFTVVEDEEGHLPSLVPGPSVAQQLRMSVEQAQEFVSSKGSRSMFSELSRVARPNAADEVVMRLTLFVLGKVPNAQADWASVQRAMVAGTGAWRKDFVSFAPGPDKPFKASSKRAAATALQNAMDAVGGEDAFTSKLSKPTAILYGWLQAILNSRPSNLGRTAAAGAA